MTTLHELSDTPTADETTNSGELEVTTYPLPEHTQEQVDQLGLSTGYGLIGGGARAVASELLLDRPMPVRDIDVAGFTDYNPDQSLAPEVSARLMPDDSAFGWGVKFTSLQDYFGTRDFTMNELAVIDGQLLITPQAEQDLRDNVIRPTRFEHNPDDDWYLSPKLAVKAVLMQTVLERTTDQPAHIEEINLNDYHCDMTEGGGDSWTRPFYIALGFQKALEHGEDVAEAFLDNLVGHGMVRAESLERGANGSARLAGFAKELERASDFEFRGAAAERLNTLHQLGSAHYTLGDLLHAVDRDVMEQYDRYHDVARGYGGPGRQYTDESKY